MSLTNVLSKFCISIHFTGILCYLKKKNATARNLDLNVTKPVVTVPTESRVITWTEVV